MNLLYMILILHELNTFELSTKCFKYSKKKLRNNTIRIYCYIYLFEFYIQ